MLIGHLRFASQLKTSLLLFILLFPTLLKVNGQDVNTEENINNSAIYDQIPVSVMIEGVGTFTVDVLYTSNDLLYINIEDLFNNLKIPCKTAKNGESFNGFIENESKTYSIEFNSGVIKVGDRIINYKNGLIKEAGSFYLESSLFAEAFGINLSFNFRTLSVILKSNFELPVVKQLRIEKMEKNISKLKGDIISDTIIKRNYHLFKAGTLDWAAASFQTWNGTTDNRLGLGIGTEFLYGEADVSVNYYDQYKFDNRQLQYLWRWVDNDKRIIKQAQVGKISNQTIAFINSPVLGAVIRNSPTTVRKAKGFYTINEFTEPNWTVELYINNILVDYTRADASGLFLFKVPIVYGFTTLKLKFYGPMGEERTEERTMNVPYTIMPVKQFEYSLAGGIVQDTTHSRFGKTEFNYGVNRILTIGGGLEYLSSITNGDLIPYGRITMQPFSALTLNAEYSHGVKSRVLLDYYFIKDALLELDYAKYVEGQLATRFNSLEERKAKLSIPFRFKKIIGFTKLDYMQYVYKTFNYNQVAAMISAYYKQFSANSSSQLNWLNGKPAFLTSDLALSYRLKNGFNLRSSAQFNVAGGKMIRYKAEVEKRIPKGFISGSYERNVLFKDNFVTLNFKYDLNFARTSVSASHNNGNFYTSQSAQGSMAFGSGNGYVYKSNNSSISKGGISVYPFYDANNNGVFDKDEHMVKLNTVKIFGGKTIFSKQDSIIRIADLNAFVTYNMEFSDIDLENFSWRFKTKKYQVLIDPNQFKRIDVPVITVGEVSGMTYIDGENTLKGIGRILVKFYKKDSDKPVAEALSESDGYLYYMGFEPGEYVARIDSAQLSNLNFSADPMQASFKINALKDGDIIEGLSFVLSPISMIAEQKTDSADLNALGLNVSESEVSEKNRGKETVVYMGNLDLNAGPYFVQVGAFRKEDNAKRLYKKLSVGIQYPIGVIIEDGYYKVRLGYFSSKEGSAACSKVVLRRGLPLFRGRNRKQP